MEENRFLKVYLENKKEKEYRQEQRYSNNRFDCLRDNTRPSSNYGHFESFHKKSKLQLSQSQYQYQPQSYQPHSFPIEPNINDNKVLPTLHTKQSNKIISLTHAPAFSYNSNYHFPKLTTASNGNNTTNIVVKKEPIKSTSWADILKKEVTVNIDKENETQNGDSQYGILQLDYL